MKRLIPVAKILFLVLTLISFGSCWQYPDGPVFTLQTRDERMDGSWALIRATDPNGIDITAIIDTTIVFDSIPVQDTIVNPDSSTKDTTIYVQTIDTTTVTRYHNLILTIDINRSGDKNWSYFKDELIQSIGTFQFTEHNDYLVILYTYLNGLETYTEKFYTIRKLTDKEFVFIDDSGITLEWQKY